MTDTPTEPFGIERARELLLAALESQGRDFIYNPDGEGWPCYNGPLPVGFKLVGWAEDSYTEKFHKVLEEGDPRTITGCIIGTALTLGGYTYHLDQSKLGDGVFGVAYYYVGDSRKRVVVFDDEAGLYFRAAQKVQDHGSTWGAAYDAAEAWWVEYQAGMKGDGS